MVAVAVDGNGVIVVILTVWAILNAVGGLGRGKGKRQNAVNQYSELTNSFHEFYTFFEAPKAPKMREIYRHS